MLQRFMGESGRSFLIEALGSQPVTGGLAELAAVLCDACAIETWEPGDVVITEGGGDNDLRFLLAGTVSVLVKGRRVATRKAGQHVGEMALLDPGATRSATLVAEEKVVAAQISAVGFREVAGEHPLLWRNLAKDLATRLRQRNEAVAPINEVPKLFLGCSTESLAVAEAIATGLNGSGVEVRLWTDGIFRPSTFALESLEAELGRADFAALVLSPDDTVTSRNESSPAPRDNVVFELGLFMGALGHARTFLVTPEGAPNKVPSDLVGLTRVTYQVEGPGVGLAAAVGSACLQMAEVMSSAGPR